MSMLWLFLWIVGTGAAITLAFSLAMFYFVTGVVRTVEAILRWRKRAIRSRVIPLPRG